ncbi:MAG TPA: ATP-binding protein [Candidatus Cloacimonadota bacterium]|nr:ATP-binding protein [Candidatus Cloacimonadota bacterium]HPT72447.1 ATP-binding protein [Candidatus Cloacimonadota bacterium]
MRIIIQNHLSEITRINDIIDEISLPWRLPSRVSAQLSLVMDELLSNIIRYAFEDDSEHQIEINLELLGNKVVVEVVDDGIEFNPMLYPEPDLNPNLSERKIGGLGIHIIKKMTHEFTYERENGHNIHKICKLLDQ